MKLHRFLPGVCEACSYAGSRTQLVADEEGDEYTGVMVVGEAPGFNEDAQGRPFVGRSGRYLERLLAHVELSRQEVYITNTVRCRPPRNATPKPGALAEHRPILEAALTYAKPHTVLTMGATALAWFDASKKLSACHGKPFMCNGVKVVPTYHPAYAMRKPSYWAVIVADVEALRAPALAPARSVYKRLTADELTGRLQALSPGTQIGFDIETTDTKRAGVFYPHEQRVLGYSVAFSEGDAVFVYGEPCWKMVEVLEDGGVRKVCHNAKFEMQVMAAAYGVEMRNVEDTKVAAYLLGMTSTGLKDLTEQVLDVKQTRLEDVTRGRPTSEVGVDEWVQYAAADADLTLRLWGVLERRLRDEGLIDLYEKFEAPIVPILARAERRGVRAAADELAGIGQRVRQQREQLAERLAEWLPGVNLASTKQVGEVLFGETKLRVVATKALKTRTHIRYIPPGLGLAATKRTAGGSASLDKGALAALEARHPCVAMLREYNMLGDYLSDFIEKIPRLLRDGVLYTNINQAGTWEDTGDERESPATGRLSSSDPNIMQIPVRTLLGREVRKAFKARPGYVWVSADVQQEEPRLLALMAGEANMLAKFERGEDIYWPIAELIKKVLGGEKLLDKDERDARGLKYRDTSKTVFLGMQYLAGPDKIASVHPDLGKAAALTIWREFGKMYPGIATYQARIKRELWRDGWVATYFGRKRWLPGVWVEEQREEAVRQAVNHPIQGTGADVLKGCIVRLFGEQGSLRPYDAHFLFPVHDSIEMEVSMSCLDEVLEVVRHMTDWFTAVKLPVDIKVGPSWGELA